MSTLLYDQFGRKVGTRNLYPSPSSHPQDNRPRPIVRSKIYENQTPYTRWEQVNYSKILSAQVTGIDAALEMKSCYSVGDAWHIVYHGNNQAWGDRMEEFFHQAYFGNCNQIGSEHDWHSTLRSLSRALDVEADFAVWFDGVDTPTRPATGQFQILDYSRIGTGIGWCVKAGEGLEQVRELGNAPYGYNYANGYYSGWGSYLPFYLINDPASRFDGQRIIDGIIVDQNLRRLGYRVLGYNDQGQMTYADVPTEAIHFNYEVGDWINQLRGIPRLANLLDDANSVSDIKYYWQQGVMIASQKMVMRKSIDGRPSSGVQETEIEVPNPTGDGTTVLKMVRVEDAPAGVVELSSRRGEELATLDLNRPAMQEQQFVKLIETAYFHKHWPRCLIYPEDASRAPSRSIAQQVQVILRKRQMTLERTARWICNRRIALAMQRGELPQNNNLYDPYHFGFTVPQKYTVDEGNDAKMALSMLGRCCISRGAIIADQGFQEKKVLRQNFNSVDAIAAAAEELKKRHPWMTENDAMNRLDNNGNPNVQPAVPSANEPETEADDGEADPSEPGKTAPVKE